MVVAKLWFRLRSAITFIVYIESYDVFLNELIPFPEIFNIYNKCAKAPGLHLKHFLTQKLENNVLLYTVHLFSSHFKQLLLIRFMVPSTEIKDCEYSPLFKKPHRKKLMGLLHVTNYIGTPSLKIMIRLHRIIFLFRLYSRKKSASI